jgi:hypothetical protein
MSIFLGSATIIQSFAPNDAKIYYFLL